jgi:para-aminobenzoate synthetase/4-amino-4-deoxychorismate lyase
MYRGDIYQANLTFRPSSASPLSPRPFAAACETAPAPATGLCLTGRTGCFLFAELFFPSSAADVTTRPMKGTRARADPRRSSSRSSRSAPDPKQRAREFDDRRPASATICRAVSEAGTVQVPDLFCVETYPTIHQMTSTVTAELEEGLGPVDALTALFPCGSITGAPKIRAMEVIAELERGPRGAYTGSIGRLAPDGEASFNVAIRTLTIRAGEAVARLGLGSGIVADSRPADEWDECLAKGAFLAGDTAFDLIETMRFDPADGVAELDRHLARMKRSADALGFRFDRHDARNELQAATFRLREAKLLRLLLAPSGAVAIEARPLPPHPEEPVPVAVAPLPVEPTTSACATRRATAPSTRPPGSVPAPFECLFRDQAGFFTEGSFTHIFVEEADGRLLTPPLSRGLLPGILRERLIEEGDAVEADLRELPSEFYVGNDVRGLIRATLGSVPPI